jgi:hypothetical protein
VNTHGDRAAGLGLASRTEVAHEVVDALTKDLQERGLLARPVG